MFNGPRQNNNFNKRMNRNTKLNLMSQNPNMLNSNFNNNNFNNINNMNMMNNFNNQMNFMNNNMLNQPSFVPNMNNNNMMQNSLNFKKNLLSLSVTEKDPVKLQMKIALGLNNNMPYERGLQGGNQTPQFMRQSSMDNVPKVSDDIINVIFHVQTGNKHTRCFNKNETIQQMLLKFIKSQGLMEKHLDNIYFLFNAINLNTLNNKNLTLEQFGIRNNARVTIIDLKNIIGA